MKTNVKPIILATLNGRYHHSSFALRYLYANLGELKKEAKILEFTIAQNPRDIAEAILAHEPKIVGLGVYIWNVELSSELATILRRLRPNLKIVLGGPEVSHELEHQAIVKVADLVITGEGDLTFAKVCSRFLKQDIWPKERVLRSELPDLNELASPYEFYDQKDIAHRVIYVEASRGCPYRCEYCLSALDKKVRPFRRDWFLAEMQSLLDRGVRQFKFVDRTFNLKIDDAVQILKFFHVHLNLGLFLHFEMIPDRLPEELREWIQKFPKGSLQFEVGIQTLDSTVGGQVSRKQNVDRIEENFRFLTSSTNVHTHADLIVGLPGESIESFAKGFDRLWLMGPDEIQVGILKRLKGAPIARHDRREGQPGGIVYETRAPYAVLETDAMSFVTIQRMTRFARFWDRIANRGEFPETMRLLVRQSGSGSFFEKFLELSDFLSLRHPQGHGVSLLNLTESLWVFFQRGADVETARHALVSDYQGQKRREVPGFLREKGQSVRPGVALTSTKSRATSHAKRQQAHL